MPTAPTTDEIRQQMRQVRKELRSDVEEIVENAQVLTDWRHYVRRYPWVCLGAAAAAGFLVVPARRVFRPDTAALAEALQPELRAANSHAERPSGLLTRLVGAAAPLLWQAAVSVARRQLDQFLDARNRPAQRRPTATMSSAPLATEEPLP